MANRTLGNAFRATFMDDAVQGGVFTGWTSGAYTVDQLPIEPVAQKVWTIQSLTVTADLIIIGQNDGTQNFGYGKLGTIIAGLAPQTPITQVPLYIGTGSIPFSTGLFTPPDVSLAGDLWNPAVDNLPPSYNPNTYNAAAVFLPVSATVSPPVPFEATQGLLGAFIAMRPSLVYNLSLAIYNARWQLNYDDDTTLT